MRELGLQIGTLWWREITRFRRQRSRMVGALLQPLVFWLLLGAGLNASFRPAGMPAAMNYMQYFYPGVTVLVLLFTAIFATVGTIEDRQRGFLQGVMVAPISRPTVVLGQAMGGTTLALIQGIVFLLLAPLARIPISIEGAAIAIVIMALVSFAFTNIGLVIAWRIGSTQAFPAITNLILIPAWLLSGAFFPAAGTPAILRWPMRLNPLTYAMNALRGSMYWDVGGNASEHIGIGFCIAISVAFGAFAYLLAARVAMRAAVD